MADGWSAGGWGGGWGGSGAGRSPPTGEENIPFSDEWDIFDLSGIVQPNDIDRLQQFVEVSTLGAGNNFFLASFNIASGGLFPTDTGVLLIDRAVSETFTVQYRVQFNDLPANFDDVAQDHIYLGAWSAQDYATGFFFSQAGVQYTGELDLDGNGDISLVQSQDFLPGSSSWFSAGEEVVVRIAVNAETQLAYLYITPAADVDAGRNQTLRAILVARETTAGQNDNIQVSARGVNGQASIELFNYQMSSSFLIQNLPPIALAGGDQAVTKCSIIQLDGTRSFDPEGTALTYAWRLVDAPQGSMFVVEGSDGVTQPQTPATGFTDRLFSAALAEANEREPIVVGDVVTTPEGNLTIRATGVDIGGSFYVDLEYVQLKELQTGIPFKLLRQAGISGADQAKPTFYPDQLGFYIFDLRVNDGELDSAPLGQNRARAMINVVESALPRACSVEANFMFDYMLSFWKLVEDRDRIGTFFEALSRVASTELFTLWQYEYNKSLRDIQRTINRRWLHYDLLLPEPVPALTQIKFIWSGVRTGELAATVPRVGASVFQVSSPRLAAPVSLLLSGSGPVPVQQYADQLAVLLRQNVDSSFTVDVVASASGDIYRMYVNADIPFTVTSASTAPGFSYPAVSSLLGGSGATKVAERTLKVPFSLTPYSLEEDDLFVIGRDTYRIVGVVSASSDTFPGQRVVVKDALPSSLDTPEGGTAPEVDWVIPGWVSSEFLSFYNGLVDRGDHVDFERVVDGSMSTIEVTALGANAVRHKRLAVDTASLANQLTGTEQTVYLAAVLRRRYIPVDSRIEDVPLLSPNIDVEDPEEVLRRNVDYFIEEFRGRRSIRFSAGVGTDLGDVWEGERPETRLWAEYTFINNEETIEANFGIAIGVTRDRVPDTVDYLSAVRGVWYALYNGPTVRNLRIAVQVFLGLPFAEVAGVIQEIRTDFFSQQSRILIQDADNPEIVRSYTYPRVLGLEVNPSTGAEYVVGDSVGQFAPLVTGVTVSDYVSDPTWFQGLVNQGTFSEVQKYHSFLVRVDSSAFDLEALGFAQEFVQSIKPVYTDPVYTVLFEVSGDGDEIDVIDDIEYELQIDLFDSVCSGFQGASTLFDQPTMSGDRGGVIRNEFDADNDPNNALPAYPGPEDSVGWAFDKEWLCPSVELRIETFDSGSPVDDVTVLGTITQTGREWFARLIAIQVMGGSPAADTPQRADRIRYMGLGMGSVDATAAAQAAVFLAAYPPGSDPQGTNGQSYQVEDPTGPLITALERPVRRTGTQDPYNAAPGTDVWLYGDLLPTFPDSQAVSFVVDVDATGGELIYGTFPTMPISEAALMTDTGNVNTPFSEAVFYADFATIDLTTTSTVRFTWTIRFGT